MARRSKPRVRFLSLYSYLLAAMVVVGGLLIGGFWAFVHVHGQEFASRLGRSTGRALNAEALLMPLRWSPLVVSSDSLLLKGESSSLVARAEAQELNAVLDWRALLSGLWRVNEIAIDRLTAEFKQPSSPSLPREPSSPPASGFFPTRFQLNGVAIKKADLTYKNMTAREVGLKWIPMPSGWRIDGRGGTLSVPKLPVCQVRSFHCREQDGIFLLDEATFELPPTGKVSAEGQSGKDANWKINWTGMPVRSFLSKGLEKYIDGTLSGTSRLDKEGCAQGAIQLSGASLTNVPLLSEIGKFTKDPTLQNLPLQVVSADFDYRAESLQLSNVILESHDTLRLEGRLAVDGAGKLAGDFEIGVRPILLQSVPGVREALFSKLRDGWCWAPLQVGGTLSNPTESLSQQLAPLLMGAVIMKTGSDVMEKLPAAPVDAVRDVLDLILTR